MENSEFSPEENAKRLIKWAFKAQKLSHNPNLTRNFKEREVWLTAIGHGVGSEVYGKNDDFERPVIILKKYNNHRFLGIPLTTNERYEGSFAIDTLFDLKKGKAMADQANTYDSRRLLKKMGMLDSPTFAIIRQVFV